MTGIGDDTQIGQDGERQINAALLSYCRGIDRLDGAAVLAAFHPGAMLLDYGPEPTTIEAFTERILPSLEERFTATQHRISNTAITVDQRGALVETYVLAYHVEAGEPAEPGGDGADRLYTFNGRYIDRFESRDGRWRIATRALRCDWSRIETIDATMGGTWVASGRAGTADPLDDL
ncbi:MAG: nuclear transport factor 2 family protein [Acidimicrobiales bacterium]